MKEIASLEIVLLDTGEGISININGKEIAIYDYDINISSVPLPQWVIDAISEVIDGHLGGGEDDDESARPGN